MSPESILTFTVASTLLSRRLISRANPEGVDINDRNSRLIGQRARVVEPFVGGRGRVFISGAEWAAEIDGEGVPPGADVTVSAIDGSLLKVRPAA